MEKSADSIQQRLTRYACGLSYDAIPAAVLHAAKIRVIDTLGVLIGAFFGAPCSLVRNFAAQSACGDGATLLGTRTRTTPDMAAFVNATTARYLEFTDVYHFPGSSHGHPSDVISPVLAAAEYAQRSGRDFLTAVVLAYEVYGHVSDNFRNWNFDNSNFCCVSSAAAAGRLLGLTEGQLAHCLSMSVVPNNVLRQVRTDHFSMWKEMAAGNAGRAAIFAALLARAGMDGPHLPFEGKAGWCDHVAGHRFALAQMGGECADFKILHTRVRLRAAMGETIASSLASEKVAPLAQVDQVQQVRVETYKRAKALVGTGEHFWHPDSRETADHSIPYVVAATLLDGRLTTRSFNDARLWSPELRALLPKIEVLENPGFTAAYQRVPREQRARVTVVMESGERMVGEAGGGGDDLAVPKSDQQIVDKFHELTADVLGAKRSQAILDRLWQLEDVQNMATIPPLFVL